MGGSGSGRQYGRPTTEGSITLDISRLLQDRTVAGLTQTSGAIVWSDTQGQQIYSSGFEAALEAESGWLRLIYSKWHVGEWRKADYHLDLMTTPQPFGGRRWWFVCPLTERKAQKLFLPPGALLFACRQAYQLGYQCQRETLHDRAIQRAFKLRRKLGSRGGIGDPVTKPTRMRHATFDREVAKLEAADRVCSANLAEWLARFSRAG